MSLLERLPEYQIAVSLNNIGILLLKGHCYHQGLTTLQDANTAMEVAYNRLRLFLGGLENPLLGRQMLLLSGTVDPRVQFMLQRGTVRISFPDSSCYMTHKIQSIQQARSSLVPYEPVLISEQCQPGVLDGNIENELHWALYGMLPAPDSAKDYPPDDQYSSAMADKAVKQEGEDQKLFIHQARLISIEALMQHQITSTDDLVMIMNLHTSILLHNLATANRLSAEISDNLTDRLSYMQSSLQFFSQAKSVLMGTVRGSGRMRGVVLMHMLILHNLVQLDVQRRLEYEAELMNARAMAQSMLFLADESSKGEPCLPMSV